MRITICDDKKELGKQATRKGADAIKNAISEKGFANVAFVTGASQIETLKHLRCEDGIKWECVNIFFFISTV